MDEVIFHIRRTYNPYWTEITNTKNHPRQLKSRMDIAMQDTPVVLVNGPRQSGKTTLVKEHSQSLAYYTLDDDNLLNALKQDHSPHRRTNPHSKSNKSNTRPIVSLIKSSKLMGLV